MAECLFSSAEKPGPMAEQVDESYCLDNIEYAAYFAMKNAT